MALITFQCADEERQAMKNDAFDHHMTLSAYLRWLVEKEREKTKGGK